MPETTSIIGCLLGTALGDAVGLPCERLTRERQQRLFPRLDGPSLIFGRGLVSDDTEHICMVAQALIVAAGEEGKFLSSLARQFKVWVLLLPAGAGMATLKACFKLCLGVSPGSSGVFSAGNGPAMRSAILGVCYGHDLAHLRALVRASTRLTHTDPKAEHGALAVALAAHAASRHESIAPAAFQRLMQQTLGAEAPQLLELTAKMSASVEAGQSTAAFADHLGLARGVSGYVLHTVPLALHAWLGHQDDFRGAVLEIVRCGGDTDSTAAIVGGLIGARAGRAGLPQDWLDRLAEWPRSVRWMERLGERLAQVMAQNQPQRALPLFAPAILLRNIFFLGTVLAHALRRLLPPY